MSATVVVIRDEKQWEVIQDLLEQLEQGGILVPPDTVERLDENCPGWEDMLDDKYIDYDFGGEYDVVFDIARNGNYADKALDDILIEKSREE